MGTAFDAVKRWVPDISVRLLFGVACVHLDSTYDKGSALPLFFCGIFAAGYVTKILKRLGQTPS